MASKRRKDPDDVAELLRTLLITQLGLAGVPRERIRAVVGCDTNRVTGVLKHLAKARESKKK